MSDDLPYSEELLSRFGEAIAAYRRKHGQGFVIATLAADLRKAGIGLVEPDRHRAWIDETVHSGALWRLARARAQLERYAEPRLPSAATWTSLCNSPEPSR